jgi:hypothetical protein
MSERNGLLIQIIGGGSALAGISSFMYFIGKLYKETYFSYFSINADMLDFGFTYYVMASWFPLLVVISLLIIFLAVYSITENLSAGILIPLAFLLSFYPAYDISLNTVYFEAFFLLFAAVCGFYTAKISLSKGWKLKARRNPVSIVSVLFLVIIFSAGTSYVIGRYHAFEALKRNRLNTAQVKTGGIWYNFVTRTPNGLYFIFDPDSKTCFIASETDIEAIKIVK